MVTPFKAAAFDGVDTLETLVHAPDHRLAFLEFNRVLRSGGRLVLFDQAGFDCLDVRDLTESVVPMARLLHNLGYVPYRLARRVARQGTFINAMGAVEFFRMRDGLRCNMVIARRRRAKA